MIGIGIISRFVAVEIGLGIDSLSPFPWILFQWRKVNRRDEVIIIPNAILQFVPTPITNRVLNIMPHSIGMDDTATTIKLGCCHHFLITASNPYVLFSTINLVVDNEASTMTFALLEFSSIKMVFVYGDDSKSLRQMGCLVTFAHIASAIFKHHPFVGIKCHNSYYY